MTLRGDVVAMVGSVRKQETQTGSQLIGQIYKFIDLDQSAEWFNIQSRKPAGEAEIEEIVIPAHLKPHFHALDFIFSLKHHRMGFVVSDGNDKLSVGQARKLMSAIFQAPMIVEKFGAVDVTAEPRREVLEEILQLAQLTRLNIVITPPNPDDLQDAERKLFEELEKQHANRQQTEYSSNRKEGLKPSDDTATLARIAQSNGKVVGHGKNTEGLTVDISTTDHPLIEKTKYDPNKESRTGILADTFYSVLSKIL